MKHFAPIIVGIIALLGLMATVSVAKDADKDWVKLGTRTVDYKGDKDTIEVGKSEGKFTHIRIRVEDGDLIMEKIKVTFGNGDIFEPDTRAEFREGSRSHDIELPAKVAGRVISRVDFFYHSEHKHDKATVILFGREK